MSETTSAVDVGSSTHIPTSLVPPVADAPLRAAPSTSTRALAAGQVDRLVVASVPDGMHLSRDARVALQKAATVAVMYIGCLADAARAEGQKGKAKRSTLSSQDVRDALVAAGMGHLVPLMQTQGKRGRDKP